MNKQEVEPIRAPPQASKSTTFEGSVQGGVRIARPIKGASFGRQMLGNKTYQGE